MDREINKVILNLQIGIIGIIANSANVGVAAYHGLWPLALISCFGAILGSLASYYLWERLKHLRFWQALGHHLKDNLERTHT